MTKRTVSLSIIVIWCFLLVGCSNDYSRKQSNNLYYVSEVIDGDTIRLSNGQLVRYLGIDTPELRRYINGRSVYSPQPFAEEAFWLNKKLVQNKQVRIEFDVEKYDSYGRILGYCFVGDLFVNEQLLQAGMAAIAVYPPNVKYFNRLISAYNFARQKKLGIWNLNVLSVDESYDNIGALRTLEGKVVDIQPNAKGRKLVISGECNCRKFFVYIPHKCLNFFDETYFNCLLNKEINFTGRIRVKGNNIYTVSCVPEQIDSDCQVN